MNDSDGGRITIDDASLKKLLNGTRHSNPIIVAARGGQQAPVVQLLINAAFKLKETNPQDDTLGIMLVAGCDDYVWNSAIGIAINHSEVVQILINAALTLKEWNPRDQTLSQE